MPRVVWPSAEQVWETMQIKENEGEGPLHLLKCWSIPPTEQNHEHMIKLMELARYWHDHAAGELNLQRPADRLSKAASPDAPTNEAGNQSELEHRFDLVDGPAMYEMTHVLYKGAKKYGEDNWRSISIEDHLNHLISHAYAYLAGNRDDNHLANIMCRAMFAMGKKLQDDRESTVLEDVRKLRDETIRAQRQESF